MTHLATAVVGQHCSAGADEPGFSQGGRTSTLDRGFGVYMLLIGGWLGILTGSSWFQRRAHMMAAVLFYIPRQGISASARA